MNKIVEDAELDKNDAIVVDEETQDEPVDKEVIDPAEPADDVIEEDEDSEDDSADTSFQRRFTQFKGETAEEYSKNLEEGYDNSTKEALKLKKQLDDLRAEKLTAIANEAPESKPDVVPDTPESSWAKEQMAKAMKEDYNSFVESHPLIEEDEEVFAKMDAEVKKYSNYVYSTEKRVPSIKESMEFAWKRLDMDSAVDTTDKVAGALIDAGGESSPKGRSLDRPKPRFSDKQIEVARKVDPKLKDLPRADVEKALAKYSK